MIGRTRGSAPADCSHTNRHPRQGQMKQPSGIPNKSKTYQMNWSQQSPRLANPEYLLSKMQDGDELWEFCSPPDSWAHMAGRAGIALVRGGNVLDSIVSMRN